MSRIRTTRQAEQIRLGINMARADLAFASEAVKAQMPPDLIYALIPDRDLRPLAARARNQWIKRQYSSASNRIVEKIKRMAATFDREEKSSE